MKNSKEFSFRLKAIDLLDVHINHPQKPLPAQTTFHFAINIENKTNIENKVLMIITTVKITHNKNSNILGSIKTGCIFEIPNISDFIDQQKKQVQFPDDYIRNFNSISISTIRGIMFSLFRGTFLHNAILPIIDPNSLVIKN